MLTFLASKSRNFYACSAVCGVFALASYEYFPNYVFVHKLKKMLHLYRNTKPVPVAPCVTDRVNTVMNDMKLSDYSRKFIHVFNVYGCDLYHAGTTSLNQGGIVGIPSIFSASKVDELDKGSFLVSQSTHLSQTSPVANAFLESLILSESAQKFGIAREIYHIESPVVHLKALVNGGSFGAAAFTLFGIDKYIRQETKHPVPIVLALSFLLLAIPMIVLCRDLVSCEYEIKCDNMAADLGSEYLDGGIEFYEKIIQRNKNLRSLMGPAGKKKFTIHGNDTVVLRRRHVEYSKRLDNLQKMKGDKKQ